MLWKGPARRKKEITVPKVSRLWWNTFACEEKEGGGGKWKNGGTNQGSGVNYTFSREACDKKRTWLAYSMSTEAIEPAGWERIRILFEWLVLDKTEIGGVLDKIEIGGCRAPGKPSLQTWSWPFESWGLGMCERTRNGHDEIIRRFSFSNMQKGIKIVKLLMLMWKLEERIWEQERCGTVTLYDFTLQYFWAFFRVARYRRIKMQFLVHNWYKLQAGSSATVLDCTRRDADGLYARGCSSKFMRCYNGKQYDYTCPKKLKFNVETAKCEHRRQVIACINK